MKMPPGTDASGHKLDYWIKCCEEGSFDHLLAWSPDWGNIFLKGPKMLREKADSGPESGSRVMMMCKRHKSTLTPGAKLEPTAAAAAALLQSCPTLCNPIDGSPPGSPVPGILQARTLEWVAIYGVAQSRTRLKRLSSSSINTDHVWTSSIRFRSHLLGKGLKSSSPRCACNYI